MAEFVQTMKDWQRMCDKYFDGKEWVCNKICPMYGFEVCSKPTAKYPVPLDIEQKMAHEIECVIMKWAAEHPEPTYPTWREYLDTLWNEHHKDYGNVPFDNWIRDTPIPTDIAKKLDIEPKEE